MKYRKKPVVVEAYQTDKEVIIHTLEGDMKADVGDYIITGVKGEQYPCKPDIFEQTYEKVMPDNEIKKALECCAYSEGCEQCPRSKECDGQEHFRYALNLINRLQAENERLNNRKNVYDFAECRKNEIKAEAYKECVGKVSNIITEIYNKHIFGSNDLEAEEKDAIINFSDDVTYKVDNLLKEMIGDNSSVDNKN